LILGLQQSIPIINKVIPQSAEVSQQKNPSDMESVLLQEFNLHKDPIAINNNLNVENNVTNNSSVSAPNTMNNKIIRNNISIIPNEMHKVKESLNNSLNMHIQESQFLENILESEKQLLNSLIEDVDKINKQVNLITEKNRVLREEILEYRRKINMERDNLVKATSKLYGQTNDLVNNKGNNFYCFYLNFFSLYE